MTLIKLADAVRSLESLVERKGAEFTYTIPSGASGCKYQANGCASCGIGDVLATDYGVSVDTLADLDYHGMRIRASVSLRILKDQAGVELTHAAMQMFYLFQASQDDGNLYGRALKWARDRFKETPPMDDSRPTDMSDSMVF